MRTFAYVATLACGTLLATATMAQEKKEPASAQPGTPAANAPKPAADGPAKPRVFDGYRPLPIGYYNKQLTLTPEQMTAAKDLEATAQKERGALGAELKPEERTGKVKEIMSKRDAAFKALLSADQLKTFETMRQPTGAAPMMRERAMTQEKMAPTPAPTPAPVEKK